jgi:hypothetical protein
MLCDPRTRGKAYLPVNDLHRPPFPCPPIDRPSNSRKTSFPNLIPEFIMHIESTGERRIDRMTLPLQNRPEIKAQVFFRVVCDRKAETYL